MLFEQPSAGANKAHIYLAGSLIASQGSDGVVTYQHTDALGSPVAVTNQAGQVIERHDYEPYGAIIGKPQHNGIGYTGHVMDGATGLTYMQQRYYDQSIGRFLSVDPVSADGNSGVHFNRYKYASNNPYRFIDPDGRMDREFRQELRQMRRFQAEEHEENLEKLSMVLTSRFSAMAYSVDGLELGGKDFSVSDIYIGLFGGATKSVGATQNVTKLGYSEIRSLLDESGKITHRSRESVALRKLTSHAQGKARSGDFKEARGGIAKKNAYVQSVIFEILTNKNMVKTPLSGGGFEYRVGRDGRGVRYNADGSFNTFLDSRRRGK